MSLATATRVTRSTESSGSPVAMASPDDTSTDVTTPLHSGAINAGPSPISNLATTFVRPSRIRSVGPVKTGTGVTRNSGGMSSIRQASAHMPAAGPAARPKMTIQGAHRRRRLSDDGVTSSSIGLALQTGGLPQRHPGHFPADRTLPGSTPDALAVLLRREARQPHHQGVQIPILGQILINIGDLPTHTVQNRLPLLLELFGSLRIVPRKHRGDRLNRELTTQDHRVGAVGGVVGVVVQGVAHVQSADSPLRVADGHLPHQTPFHQTPIEVLVGQHQLLEGHRPISQDRPYELGRHLIRAGFRCLEQPISSLVHHLRIRITTSRRIAFTRRIRRTTENQEQQPREDGHSHSPDCPWLSRRWHSPQTEGGSLNSCRSYSRSHPAPS